ncbi:thiamine pyrophosphate-binding protein [Catenulispora subtropica]|uniref:Sulfopyruvate decarboxylase subunit alpha n=1 Tax=Catenulispora subtropica TaxID=450798 RepID=A0ABN2T4A7_9ACTN
MTVVGLRSPSVAERLGRALVEAGFGPFFGTPCGILAPLYGALEEHADLLTIAREDNAVGVAAGAALAGGSPAVLMQNSGLGQSVNALASLVVPYRVPMLLVVSMRGITPDPTPENEAMGRLTEPVLAQLGIPARRLPPDPGAADATVAWAAATVRERRRPAALLIPPPAFGWRA